MTNLPVPQEQPEKNDAFTRILRFYMEDDITLTGVEEKILQRWIFADARIKERKYREDQIVDLLKHHFGISRYTAQNDIYNAHSLMGQVRRVSKKNLMVLHAEAIALQIQRIQAEPSMWHLLAKLNDSYTKAVAAINDNALQAAMPAPVMLLVPATGQEIQAPMSIETARVKLLEKLKKNSEAIDYEDNPDRAEP